MRGTPVLTGKPSRRPLDEEVASATNETAPTDAPSVPQEASVVMDPTPPPIEPEVLSEARLGAADLVRLGRLSAPKGSLTAYVDQELYERIRMHYEGGITNFVRDAAERHGGDDIVAIMGAEHELSERRAGSFTTTLGARAPMTHVQRVVMLMAEARRKGIPGVSKNAVMSGLVMLYAKSTGILDAD